MSISQIFLRPLQTTILPFCSSFSLGWFWSLSSIQCYKPASIVFQALCLSDLIPWLYLSLPLYNRKGLWIVIFTISWYSFVSSPLFQKYHSKYRPSWSLNVHRVLYYKRETCLMCKIKVSKVLLTRKGLRSLCVCYRSCRYCEVKDTCEYDAQDIALTLKSGGQRLGLFYDSIRSAPFKYMKV